MTSFRSRLSRVRTALLFLMGLLFGCQSGHESAPTEPAFVGREACAQCHQAETTLWTGSDHDRAMEEAAPGAVLGNFEDAAFTECGVETRFFRQDDGYFIRTQGSNGVPDTFRVRYTFGFDPLQQYLIAFPDGRLQAFSIAWDTKQKRWFSLHPEECIPPDDWLHWTKGGMNWNYMCADCHSTDVRRNFDLSSDTYQTAFAEIDVSCEACHGPGETHVRLARSGDYGTKTGFKAPMEPSPTSMESLKSRPRGHVQVETCAPCHSRRRNIHPGHRPGAKFLDHYEPQLIEEDLYFPDGQIKDEVYVYGSFLQSKMYANGVRCSDCHDPHSTDLKFEGNQLCLQCHEPAYDSFEHLRHAAGSEGSQCVDCHMPTRVYMVVDPRRDHSFKSPRPELSAEIGTPNACSGCHQDRTAEWAAAIVQKWHEDPGAPAYATAFAGARRGAPEAETELMRIVATSGSPEIIRATALSLLDRYETVRASDAARSALADSGALVRTTAVRNLEDVPESAALIEPLLKDSVRLVRMEAARVLAHSGRFTERRSDDVANSFRTALEEYRTGQMAVDDQPASHFNLAVLDERSGKWAVAENSYRTALRLDSAFVPARLNLGMLYNRRRAAATNEEESQQLFAAARAQLEAAVRLEPGSADAHYALGLLLAELPEHLEAAASHLSSAAELDSSNERILYNAGLAHQRLGRADAAERWLLQAHRLSPEHPDYLNALSVFYSQQQHWTEALRFTDRLLLRAPNNVELQRRRAYIQQQM